MLQEVLDWANGPRAHDWKPLEWISISFEKGKRSVHTASEAQLYVTVSGGKRKLVAAVVQRLATPVILTQLLMRAYGIVHTCTEAFQKLRELLKENAAHAEWVERAVVCAMRHGFSHANALSKPDVLIRVAQDRSSGYPKGTVTQLHCALPLLTPFD